MRSEHRIIDLGDVSYTAGYWDSFRDAATAKVDAVMAAGADLFSLGGDHFVTYPRTQSPRSMDRSPSSISTRIRTTTPSPRHNHGTMFFHGVLEGWIDAPRSTHIGIRTPYDHSPALGYTVLDAIYVHEHSGTEIAGAISRVVGSDRPVYVTFDIDFVDPASAPGTGTPVPGGPDGYKSREILFALDDAQLNLVAADLVEVAPLYDGPGEITVLLGATLGSDLLTLIGNARSRRTS